MPREEDRWRAKAAHYQDPAVVARYDAERFSGPQGQRSTRAKWNAIRRGLGGEFERVGSVLDVPCGTGRFTELLLGAGKHVVNADRSRAMLLTMHNLRFFHRLLERIRGAIAEDRLLELRAEILPPMTGRLSP